MPRYSLFPIKSLASRDVVGQVRVGEEFISVSEEIENEGKWQPCVSDHPAGRAGHGGRLGEGRPRIITLTIFLDSY